MAKKRMRKIFGTKEKPRLSVFRSSRNIFAQIVDDVAGHTLVSSSTLKIEKGGNIAAAKLVGEEIAKKAIVLGIKKIVFDRNYFRYHGRVKAVAEAAREGGLLF